MRNTTTLRYMKEVNGAMVEDDNKGVHRNRKTEDVIKYQSGNETIIMPAAYKENTGVNVILNIFIGLVVGVALMWFLAVPAKVQSVRSETADQIREYSDQLAARQTEINDLQSQLDALQGDGQTEEETAEAESNDYELLIDAYTSFQASDTEGAAASLDQVDPEQLSDNARAIYNEIYGTVHADEVQALFDAGSAAYDAQNYEEAVTNLQRVVDYDERYSDGYALYYLARSYENLGQNDQALEMFQRFAAAYPGTQRATYSNNAIARLQQAGAQNQTGAKSGTQTQ